MAAKRKSKKRTIKRKPVLSTAERFGARVRTWRHEQGLPLKRVAYDLQVSVSVVSQWERGLRFPSVRNLDRIAKYMDVPVCSLLYDGITDCPFERRRKK